MSDRVFAKGRRRPVPVSSQQQGSRDAIQAFKSESMASTGVELSTMDAMLTRRPEAPPAVALARLVETEIIPRLKLAHRIAAPGMPDTVDELGIPGAMRAAKFARMVLAQDVGACFIHLQSLRAHGDSLEHIFLDLLAPAARHLGDLWNADAIEFTEVTRGLWRLQQLLREMSPLASSTAERREHGRRAVLIIPVPGDQHAFGAMMVAEFFRHAGWDVASAPVETAESLLSEVRKEWFSIVGLSISAEVHLKGLAPLIHSIRRASRNRSVGVMVGGKVFDEHPELAMLVGADASARDAREACMKADGLLFLAAKCA
jgi:methylmalonyl-CoA mutase cobalamin-binding domain/chain